MARRPGEHCAFFRWEPFLGALLLLFFVERSAAASCGDLQKWRDEVRKKGTCLDLEEVRRQVQTLVCDAGQASSRDRLLDEVDAFLIAGQCGCESLRKAIERSQENLGCHALLQVGADLNKFGQCTAPVVLEAANERAEALKTQCASSCESLPGALEAAVRSTSEEKVEALYKACRGCANPTKAACLTKLCNELPLAIRNVSDETRKKQLRGPCVFCSSGVQQTCDLVPKVPVAPPPERDPAAQTLLRLRQELVKLNEEFAKDAACKTADGCPDRERMRLDKLTAYLAVLRAIGTPDDQKEALVMLRGIGLPDDLINIALKFSKEDLEDAALFKETLTNQELRKALIEELSKIQGEAAAQLAEALSSGASLATLLANAAQLAQGERRALYNSAGRLGITQNEMRGHYARQLEENQLELILPEPGTVCNGCSDFWGALEREATGALPPRIFPVADVERVLKDKVARRTAVCSGAKPAVNEPGCGAVVGVQLHPEGTSKVWAEASLRFVLQSAGGAEARAISVRTDSFGIGTDSKKEAVTAAQSLVAQLVFSFDRLRGAPIIEHRAVRIQPATYCGVKVIVEGGYSLSPSGHTSAQFAGACREPEFLTVFENEMASYGLKDHVVIQRPRGKGLSGSADGGAEHSCSVTLWHKNEAVYSAAVLVNRDAHCPDDPAARWRHAGEELAFAISRFYAQGTVQELKPPPFHHALLFSGARQLEASRGRSGWGWAIGEAGLLVAGTTLALLGVMERNAVDEANPDTSMANLYLGLGVTSFIFVVPLRLVAGAWCCD